VSNYIAYLSLTFALVITPGATTAVVVRNALSGGRRGGLSAACGAAIGNSTHAAAAGIGVAVLVSRLPSALITIRLAGGLYLAWLGAQSALRMIRRTAVPAASSILAASGNAHLHHAVREGAVANLLNPAIITFYLTVVPTFVPVDARPWYYALLAATHVAMALVVHSAWVFALDRLRHVIERPAARLALEAVTATALAAFSWRVLSALLPALRAS
jgi:threonine/homoserine/homoserine lactone efflux protein